MYSLGGFPGVVRGTGEITVEGYLVDRNILRRMDRLEGYYGRDCSALNMYNREKVQTPYGTAWMYIWNGSTYHLNKVESGDWFNRERSIYEYGI
jgi:gamma-glutamylcyclotransferase (GGCT)/AIG2-like uncharacterized protein YtfP